ncbi:MAG: glycosyltransferase [Sedimenticola sp.]
MKLNKNKKTISALRKYIPFALGLCIKKFSSASEFFSHRSQMYLSDSGTTGVKSELNSITANPYSIFLELTLGGNMRALQIGILLLILLAALFYLNREESDLIIGISLYGAVAITYILLKILASSWYKPYTNPAPEGLTIAAVIPIFNEDPVVFRNSLKSLVSQTRPVEEIWVIDDGSDSRECYLLAKDFFRDTQNAHVLRYDDNRGKRHAQSLAFRESDADIFMTCDSDAVLDEKAVEEALRPFADPEVQVVTADVRGLNRSNLLSKLIDLRYQNAFKHERAAYSVFGSVLCATGVLSFYRGDTIRENLDKYLSQTFLGVPVMAGDDRRLTNYSLERGKSVIQLTSKAETTVPDKLGKFLRQQIRWNKSFFRESLYVLKNLGPKRIAWWLTLAEMSLWIVFGATILLAFIIAPLAGGKLLSVYYIGYISIMAYIRNLQVLSGQPWLFILSPLYGLLHIVLLIPLRFYSLLTIRNSSWMTRAASINAP